MHEISIEGTVHIIDDDPDDLKSTQVRLEAAGYNTKTYESIKDFMAGYAQGLGCLVLHLRLPEMDGLELQRYLNEQPNKLPVIVITAFPELAAPQLAAAVESMKLGAIDFIKKPFNDEVLMADIAKALARSESDNEKFVLREDAKLRLDSLTARENEILAHVFSGESNRSIAEKLGISQRTVETHRANIMNKTHAKNLAELLLMASRADLHWKYK